MLRSRPIEDLLPIPMPSISLDGLSTLKRDENFYLWLALRLAIEEMPDAKMQRIEGKNVII
ncbi:hypothetical protein [Nostoc sp.]|uniref:hypothetical protein n=1 Tax=Nostoc sp. TaxID=1180 RepID=UPI002FF728D7